MFTITKLAYSATKLENKAVRTFAKVAKEKKHDFKPMVETYNHFAQDSEKIFYSKNIFKKCVNWVKSFVKNYKTIKNIINDKIGTLKENYGEFFTKKREKGVKKTMVNYLKKGFRSGNKELKENKYGFYEKFQNFIERKQQQSIESIV